MIVWNQLIFSTLLVLGSFELGNSQRKQGRNIAVGSEGKPPVNFDCPEEFGYYPHPTDCTQYYVCVFGGALLESCTGGLMYSHELQTCDWPRNVGCDDLGQVSVTSPGGGVSVSVQPASRTSERVRYTVVPTVQPQAVISSRGQSRQLHATVHERVHERERVHAQDIITKQQQQQRLYADAEDVLPPAEEIENDRQQRVYRGQPSTVGQVQRDRDGLRHTNAIPSSSRSEKIGVISFGTQQQQPVQQYRNNTLYIDDSLTNNLTEKRRRKRQTRRRHVPHIIYHQQQPKHTYQSHRLNTMELQPPPQRRYKPQQVEYSAILSGDQTEFQPFAPNPIGYKLQLVAPSTYVLPKVKKPTNLQPNYNFNVKNQFPQNSDENYSYFNLGTIATTPANVVYAPSNQAHITQAYYQPNSNQNAFKPITDAPSHAEYVNTPKIVPKNQESVPQTYNKKPQEETLIRNDESEETSNENEDEQEEDIKPEFPSPPSFFLKSSNKYEHIENPFADPNFDFDKFISKIRGDENLYNNKQINTEAKYETIATQNDSKEKVIHTKTNPNIDLRTPVAFSPPTNKKKVNTKPIVEDYYYDDDEEDEEEIYEKPKKPYTKQDYEIPVKTTSATKSHSPINKNYAQVNIRNNKNLPPPVTIHTDNKKTKPLKEKEQQDTIHKNVKPSVDDYEYYDDYDYTDSDEESNEKYVPAPQVKKPPPVVTTIKSVIKHENLPKITNITPSTHKVRPVSYENFIYQNTSQNDAVHKRAKFNEKAKEIRTSPAPAIRQKYITTSRFLTQPVTPSATVKFTREDIKNRQTSRLLTTTLRPNRDRDTTRKPNTKISRLEESNVGTQSHSVGTSQSTPSSRTLYNGSQQYDPTQYDPYYTLYEDDVELYRDVDYTQQQQYTSNKAQQTPQHTYRGTPAPISVPVQSTIQEESVPQRNSAYYSTQAQDVYSSAQDYHEDNYNTQVDDQTNYRQSSRQPSRGDRNELNYFVESTPKSTTTIRTTTTTTTTTSRPIPVQKQSVLSSRSPIIASANQTRPQPIIITLSATPGQNSSATQTPTITTTTKRENKTDSLDPEPSSHFISLSTGFNLRQTDKKSEVTPVTYKPQFTQISSTTDSSDSVGNRPAPFSLTKLPDNETKSVIFRLSSRLSALSSDVSESESQASVLHIRSTESPNKRAITVESNKHTTAHIKSTDSTHIIPTTYSPSRTILASILPKYADNISTLHSEENSSEERLISILPKKSISNNSGIRSNIESINEHQRKSVIIEHPIPDTLRFQNIEKPVKTIIRKLPITTENTTPSSFSSRHKGERKIISKIHFGFPQSYTSPEKINNLATTPNPFASSTPEFEDYANSQESSKEQSNNYVPESIRAVTAHYITTDLTTTNKPKFLFNSNPTTERGNLIKYTPINTEKSLNSENFPNSEETSSSINHHSRFSFNSKSSLTTERGNSVKYTPRPFETLYFDNYEVLESSTKTHSRFNTNLNLQSSSTTEDLSNTENTEQINFKHSFNTHSNPTTERTTYAKYKFSTIDKSFREKIDDTEDSSSSEKLHSRFAFNMRLNPSFNLTETPYNITVIKKPITFNYTTNLNKDHENSFKYITSTTENQFNVENNSSSHKPYFRFVYNSGPTPTTEHRNYVRHSTTENKLPYSFTSTTPSTYIPSTVAQNIMTRPLYHYTSTTTTERPNTFKYIPSSSASTTYRYSTSTISTTTAGTSNIASTVENTKFSNIPDKVTEKYRFIENISEVPDTDDKVLSQLFINRNTKPFRATAELPTVSEILATQDELSKKELVDNPPTYKPKPFSLTSDTNRNRTSADASRNVTLPVRLSRVNTAIKSLTAFGGTRRNSQTPKCNENQTTPDTKCNEIQKQRTSTRGRGSAHYTSAGTGDNLTVNRGTPATPRSRPTLKPSTSIVSKASEYIDIYRYPPHRPDPIYPQPQVDKTAAKCRKDVCLLPDCSCGGKEIPGDLPVEQVPQIVLLTFDDSVNDLNKGLYSDLFEKGRTNPNGCPIAATFYVSHEWTDYSQVQNLYADGHELASHTVSHSFGEQFSQKKWNREVAGQREILSAYGGVHLEDVRGMRAPFLSVGGNKMFKMLYDSNFTYDSSLPVYENRPPSWPYTLDYKLFHDCMIPPCPTRSYPGVWEVPMVMWQDLNGGRCSMGDACSNPPEADGVYKMLMKNFERHYTTNRAPFGLFYHAAWFTQPHHKEGFIRFLDFLVSKDDVYLVTNWQAIQWVREPTPLNRIKSFQPFQCNYFDRPKRCNNPKVCNLWHKSGVRYMKTCQPCPDIYPWTGKTGIRSSRIDNDIED